MWCMVGETIDPRFLGDVCGKQPNKAPLSRRLAKPCRDTPVRRRAIPTPAGRCAGVLRNPAGEEHPRGR
jgi:hypothetical protein